MTSQNSDQSGSRRETTAMLGRLVERRLTSRHYYWASEVSFDKGTPQERRIDYVGFKPYTPNYAVEPTSVEKGIFVCYEVKSCMPDFTSGNGLTFYGDRNYLVCPLSLYEQLKEQEIMLDAVNAVLCPSRSGLSLIPHPAFGYDPQKQSYRRRVASEMLWQIVQANHERGQS